MISSEPITSEDFERMIGVVSTRIGSFFFFVVVVGRDCCDQKGVDDGLCNLTMNCRTVCVCVCDSCSLSKSAGACDRARSKGGLSSTLKEEEEKEEQRQWKMIDLKM